MWLLGVIVSFYFGARHQVKAQEFRREIAAGLTLAPEVGAGIVALEAQRAELARDDNPALVQWQAAREQVGQAGRDN